jgi:hypothetical protein
MAHNDETPMQAAIPK